MNNLTSFVCLKAKGNSDITCPILDSNKLLINNQ